MYADSPRLVGLDDLWRLLWCRYARSGAREDERQRCVHHDPAAEGDANVGLGVSSYDVSLEKQEVLVTGDIAYDDLLAMIKKTGKEVSAVTMRSTAG